jgi:hypothetical protein
MVTATAITGAEKAGPATIIQTNKPTVNLCKSLERTLILLGHFFIIGQDRD